MRDADLAAMCGDFLKDAGYDQAKVDAFVRAGLNAINDGNDDNRTMLATYAAMIGGLFPGCQPRIFHHGHVVGPGVVRRASFRFAYGGRIWERGVSISPPTASTPAETLWMLEQAAARVGDDMRRDLGIGRDEAEGWQ